MRENRVRTAWAEGRGAITAWLTIANSYSAELHAAEDFDAITVDVQHGMVNYQQAYEMMQAISTGSPAPFARVPWNDPAAIMKMLDGGAYGIVCPMINSREECERFVGACRYAPTGYRSFGPARGLLHGGPDYFEHANETIVTLAMIETRQALDNLDEIVAVDGLDAVYIGPNDLAISLGYPPAGEPEAQEVIDAVGTIFEKSKKAGVRAGIHVPSGDSARRRVDEGFDFCAIANDAKLLTAAAQREIAAFRG
ncbi:MAG: aldolase/citrate lyase family protein [Rhodospirillales bacterium]|nr:aldolase/citrate lyase family protein [Rhodospirillales bacterium]